MVKQIGTSPFPGHDVQYSTTVITVVLAPHYNISLKPPSSPPDPPGLAAPWFLMFPAPSAPSGVGDSSLKLVENPLVSLGQELTSLDPTVKRA